MKYNPDEIQSLYLSGLPVAEISRLTGASKGSVNRILAATDTPRRDRRQNPAVLKPQSMTIPEAPTTLAYLAGIIDGEGNITIYPSNRKFRVVVYNGSKPLLNWIEKTFVSPSAFISWDDRTASGKHRQIVGSWIVYRTLDIYALLNAVSPYMIVKQDAAIEVIRLIQIMIKGQ